jgi:hypothetical protein
MRLLVDAAAHSQLVTSAPRPPARDACRDWRRRGGEADSAEEFFAPGFQR